MGKTIIVLNLDSCKKCIAYGKIGCYFSTTCSNQVSLKDNNIPNKLMYEVKEE